MPEDSTNDVYDSLIKSHHEMVSKMYEDAIDPVLEKMYQDDELSDNNSNFSFYADQIKDSLKKVSKIVHFGR